MDPELQCWALLLTQALRGKYNTTHKNAHLVVDGVVFAAAPTSVYLCRELAFGEVRQCSPCTFQWTPFPSCERRIEYQKLALNCFMVAFTAERWASIGIYTYQILLQKHKRKLFSAAAVVFRVSNRGAHRTSAGTQQRTFGPGWDP